MFICSIHDPSSLQQYYQALLSFVYCLELFWWLVLYYDSTPSHSWLPCWFFSCLSSSTICIFLYSLFILLRFIWIGLTSRILYPLLWTLSNLCISDCLIVRTTLMILPFYCYHLVIFLSYLIIWCQNTYNGHLFLQLSSRIMRCYIPFSSFCSSTVILPIVIIALYWVITVWMYASSLCVLIAL